MTKKAKAAAPDAGATRTPGKHLTTRQWAEAEALYATGDATLTQIAEKHGMSMNSVFMHMKRFGIKKNSKKEEHAKAISAAVEAATVGDATVLASRIRETKEEHYKMAAALAKLTWNEILQTKQNGTPVAAAMNNLRALDAAMGVLKKAREERYSVLGLDRTDFVDEEGLPELVISELTAEQILALQARDNDFEELSSEVVSLDDDGEIEELS